ncbi:MAG: phosphomannomutase/phosphoglucomutase [Pseudomonadales bacterium]|nr:phosphomannomutase/phosphoglucomutase [Pseudomonadales bacterium]
MKGSPSIKQRTESDNLLPQGPTITKAGGPAKADKPPARVYSSLEAAEVDELEISAEIFRAYDIRGVFEKTLTIETVELIGQAIGSEVIDQGEQVVVVAADGRLSSPALTQALISGLTSTGCKVIDIGITATPVLYFGLHHLGHQSGVMITGSHNPVDYNGLKIVIDGVTLSEQRIQDLYTRVISGDMVTGTGQVESTQINNKYVDRICNDVALLADSLKLVVDCGNGIAGNIAPFLLKALGCEVIELYCDVDGSFPNHPPDPSKSENLQDLIACVSAEGADLGLAFDGDGDRLVVVSGSGKIIQPDRLMMLFVQDILARNPAADVVFDVKSSNHLAAVISDAGGRPVMWKSGHSLIKAKSDEIGALLAGEFSGHLFFRDRWYGFDDGMYSAARLLEVLSTEGASLDDLMSEFPWSPSTPELEIEMPDSQKFAFVSDFLEQAQFEGGSRTVLDGVRIDFPYGWGLVRASNTMPKLTLRFEADNEECLSRIQDMFKQQLLAVDNTLSIPF